MRIDDPFFQFRWLMALCAAVGLAFLFAVANAGCAPPPTDDEVREAEAEGGEMPAYAETTDQADSDDEDMLGLYDPNR